MFTNLTTIENAKAVMPLITRICADLDNKWREALAMRKEAEANISTMTTIQKADFESDIEVVIDQAKSYIEEIEQLGGIAYGFEPMTVHFPILYRCGEYVLCYILGDEKLDHFHLIDDDCDGRQPLSVLDSLDAPF